MSRRHWIARSLAGIMATLAAGLHAGCGMMFTEGEDSCSGTCSTVTDCPIMACACANKVTRVGLGCTAGCCLAKGEVCSQACEGHGGVDAMSELECTPTSSCQSCSGATCNCWDGSHLPAGCVSSYSGSSCCLSGVTQWESICHGYCIDHGGLQGVAP